METIVKSRWFKAASITAGVLLVALVSFAGGVSVGIHKARFSADFGKNYERNFMGSKMMSGRDGSRSNKGFMRGKDMERNFEGRDFRNAHGLAGAIISIADNSIVIVDRDNKENTVAVNEKTLIKNGRDDWKITDLKTGDQLVIMGAPDENGVIIATLVRVFNNNGTN
jgi:hypothetical protein